jgi:hypothetical protein
MIKTNAKEQFICGNCDQEFPTKNIYIELKCGHSICSACTDMFGGSGKESFYKCKIHHLSLNEEDIANDPSFIKISGLFDEKAFNCALHDEPIEYFSKKEKKLYCMRCISQFMDNQFDYSNVNSVERRNLVRDIYKIQLKMNQIFANLPFYLTKQQVDTNFISQFMNHSLNLIELIDKKTFMSNLDLFRLNDNSTIYTSTLKNSKVQISYSQIIANLRESSTIVTSIEDENFIRGLFDKKLDLGLLFRASKHGYDADTFHRLCDNRGPTLCIFKSDKNKIFGGFSDKSWFSQICFKASKNSFLFSVSSKKKLKLFRNYDKALFFNKTCGPCFGEDIVIGDKSNEAKSCRSCLGRAYETVEGYYESSEAQKSMTGFPVFALLDYEVYLVKFTE